MGYAITIVRLRSSILFIFLNIRDVGRGSNLAAAWVRWGR